MDLDKYIAEEMARYEGRCFPVKTGMLKRLLTKKQPCKNLHPNPDDEFSKPEVGPSYRIISEYEQKIRRAKEHSYEEEKDPIIIEKMYPEGYLIINGHHRWGPLFVWVYSSNFYSFDLDEVLFVSPLTHKTEPELMFPFIKIYKERLRLGTSDLLLGQRVWL